MSLTVLQERLPLPQPFRSLTLVFPLLLIGFPLALLYAPRIEGTQWPIPVLCVVGAVIEAILLVLTLTLTLGTMSLHVTAESVTLSYGLLWRRRIPFTELRDPHITAISPLSSGGIGVRWTPERTTTLLLNAGPAVEFTAQTTGRRYRWRTDQPERLNSLLEARILAAEPAARVSAR